MGVFIGLKLCVEDLKRIVSLQESIELNNPVHEKDIHCTLFSSVNNFNYITRESISIKIDKIYLGKIKTQSGIDCLALFFTDEALEKYHYSISHQYNVEHMYKDCNFHITLSYDCGEIELKKIELEKYLNKIEFVEEYCQELKFEVNRRKEVRNA